MAQSKVPDHGSSEAKDYRRWYGLKAWRDARHVHLSRQPLCERCLQSETVAEAEVVNHRIPHKGNWPLFIDPENHESVCAPHHDGLIQREEKRGRMRRRWPSARPGSPLEPMTEGVEREVRPTGLRTRGPPSFAPRINSQVGGCSPSP